MTPFGFAKKLRLLAVARAGQLRRFLRARAREARIVLAVTVGVVVLVVSVILSRRADLRFVNTYDEPLVLFVDGARKTMLPTVAAETPDAGVRIRLGPGTHRMRTETATGVVVDDTDLRLSPYASYLVAPGTTDQCFFVEHTAYGEATALRPPITALVREERIWRMPDEVDAWFVPNPPASSEDKRSSGGTRTAIRQARCGFEPWK